MTCATLIGHGSYKKDHGEILTGTLLAIVLVISFPFAVSEYHQPKAIEVYQGKTTLEYTIKNNVKIDSVVVYKNKNH